MNAAALLSSLIPGALPLAGAGQPSGAPVVAGAPGLLGESGAESAFAQALAGLLGAASTDGVAAPSLESTPGKPAGHPGLALGKSGLVAGKEGAPGQTGVHPHGAAKPGKSLLSPGHMLTDAGPAQQALAQAAAAASLSTTTEPAALGVTTAADASEGLLSTISGEVAAAGIDPLLQPTICALAPPVAPHPATGDLLLESGVLAPAAGSTDAPLGSPLPDGPLQPAGAAPVQTSAPAPAATPAPAGTVAPIAADAAAPSAALDLASAPETTTVVDDAASETPTTSAPTSAEISRAVQALAAGPAPTRSQAVDHSARPTPHPLAQALAAMEGEVLSATGFTVADAETTAAQPAAGQTAPVAAEGDALPDAAALLAARPALSPRADAAVAAAPKSPASITDKSDKTDKKAASADGVAAAPSTASAARPAAAGAKPATGSDAPAGAEVHARSQAPVDAGAADDAFEPAVQMEAAAEARHAEAQAQTRADAVIRGAPETVAKLAAEIARKLEQRNTRFELALDPAGLGGVQVSLEINARGELAAHMSFERPEAAAELRGRAQELQRALEQAGFEVGKESLSFEHGGQREFAGREGAREDRPGAHHARAFEAALNTAELADGLPVAPQRLLGRARSGVNLTV